MHDMCGVKRRRFRGTVHEWRWPMVLGRLSAGEIGCHVRGWVMREEGLSTKKTKVAKSTRQGARRRANGKGEGSGRSARGEVTSQDW